MVDSEFPPRGGGRGEEGGGRKVYLLVIYVWPVRLDVVHDKPLVDGCLLRHDPHIVVRGPCVRQAVLVV